MNKILININSRIYTVVAEEDTEYLERLCEYVNDKVKLAKAEGSHITGEKPLVLAALNICDEYFKLLDNTESSSNISGILLKNKELQKELDALKAESADTEEHIASMEGDFALTERMLKEAEEKIKYLEEQVVLAEQRTRKQRGEFAIRERELLDMLESK